MLAPHGNPVGDGLVPCQWYGRAPVTWGSGPLLATQLLHGTLLRCPGLGLRSREAIIQTNALCLELRAAPEGCMLICG